MQMKKSSNLQHRRYWLFFLILIILGSQNGLAVTQKIKSVRVAIGQCTLLDLTQNIKRVSITNPDIADATVISPQQLMITGKELGSTSMVIWRENESYSVYRITVHNEATSHQVMLFVRFVEVNLIAFKEFGVDFIVDKFKMGSQNMKVGSFGGKVGIPNDPLVLSDVVDFFLSVPDKDISSIIKAMEEKNELTVLAKPNLCAINGAEAMFHAGGEFPIPIVSGSAGMQTVTIQFKEFGVKLKFVPTVLDSELVNIQVAAEVSNLDFENGVTLSGFRIPSLVTRKTETTVELKQGQYLILGGLLSKEISETVSKIPGLGQIPVLGKLFTSSRFQNKETELLIIVTPKIIQAMNENELPVFNKS